MNDYRYIALWRTLHLLGYLIITVSFLADFEISVVFFSFSWLLCYFFKKNLPQVPHPKVKTKGMHSGAGKEFLFFLLFNLPPLLIALVYHVSSLFGLESIISAWPIQRIIDVIAQPAAFGKTYYAVKGGFEFVYVADIFLKLYFFSFVFYSLHRYLFSMDSFKNPEINVSGFSTLQAGAKKLAFHVLFLAGSYYLAANFFIEMVAGSEKNFDGQKIGYLIGHNFLISALALLLLWYFNFLVAKGLVNTILTKIIFGR